MCEWRLEGRTEAFLKKDHRRADPRLDDERLGAWKDVNAMTGRSRAGLGKSRSRAASFPNERHTTEQGTHEVDGARSGHGDAATKTCSGRKNDVRLQRLAPGKATSGRDIDER